MEENLLMQTISFGSDSAVNDWFRYQDKSFYAEDIKKLVYGHQKFQNRNGENVKKWSNVYLESTWSMSQCTIYDRFHLSLFVRKIQGREH